MKLLRLRARYRRWRAARKLRKSGYVSWAMYRHNRDPYVCRFANSVDVFYKTDYEDGYKFVYVIEDHHHHAYKTLYNYGPGGTRYGYQDIQDWCEKNCRFRHRADIHRVWKGQHDTDYKFNDIGGLDYVFFAFMDERDYILFLLRWA